MPPSLTATCSLFMGRLQYRTCIFNEASPDREEDHFARIRDEALQLIWVFEKSFMRIFASNLWSQDIKNNLLIIKKPPSSVFVVDAGFLLQLPAGIFMLLFTALY